MAETETRGRVRIEDGPKRVRVYLGGELVADSTSTKLVWEVPYYPAYYFPQDDVRMELLAPSGRTEHSPSRGEAEYFTMKVAATAALPTVAAQPELATATGRRDREVDDAAWHYPDSPLEELRGLVRFEWGAFDNWFEEDEEVFIHPRDPHTRVDILNSSRHIEVIVNGVKVADTHRPTLLFETGLPTRYYVPKVDVRLDLLTPTDTQSGCPYKGFARYWSVKAGDETVEDLAWSYPTPLPESTKIASLVSFYNEKVDLIVDGQPLERPKTKFS